MSLRSVKEYFAPDRPEEVLELLEKYGEGALIVAGGSFVRGLDARGILSEVEVMISLQNLGLRQITADANGLSLGAMVTFTELQQRQEVKHDAAFGAIQDALTYPPLQIRNVATVGGNIAAACPYFDLPTALLSLDGVVQAYGPEGSRTVDLQAFFDSLFQSTLAANEFVTGLVLPVLPARSSSAFLKLETNANDLAIVNVAVRITLDQADRCQAARVFVGGGGAQIPVRAGSAEAVLQGEKLSDELIQRASAAVPSDLQPMSDHRGSGAYRSAMAKTMTGRALHQALARLN